MQYILNLIPKPTLQVQSPLTLRLAIGMVNVDVHWPMQGADKGGLIGT